MYTCIYIYIKIDFYRYTSIYYSQVAAVLSDDGPMQTAHANILILVPRQDFGRNQGKAAARSETEVGAVPQRDTQRQRRLVCCAQEKHPARPYGAPVAGSRRPALLHTLNAASVPSRGPCGSVTQERVLHPLHAAVDRV